MAVLRDFVPENVSLSWGGIALTGYAPDTFVTVRRNSANTTATVGAAGDVGITKNADRTGSVEITLMQNADSHRYLSAIQNLQDFGGSLIRADLTITDPSGGFICVADNAHIMEPPEVSLGSDQNNKTWTFFAETLIFTDAPAGFVQTAGEISRVASAVEGVKSFSDKILSSL